MTDIRTHMRSAIIPLFLLIAASIAPMEAQTWKKITSIEGGQLLSLIAFPDGSVIAQSQKTQRIYRSTDDGLHWTAEGTLTRLYDQMSGSSIIGYNNGMIVRSNDQGKTWSTVVDPNSFTNLNWVPSCAVIGPGGALFVGTGEGLYRSLDAGTTWKLTTSGSIVSVLCYDERTIIVGLYDGIGVSSDSGSTWTYTDTEISGASTTIIRRAADGSVIAGCRQNFMHAVFRSTNQGVSWSRVYLDSVGGQFSALAASADGTVIGSGFGMPLVRSTDHGVTWEAKPGAVGTLAFNSLVHTPSGKMIGAAGGAGLFSSVDGGSTWSPSSGGINEVLPERLTVLSNGDLIAHVTNAWIYRSTDHGQSWIHLYKGMPSSYIPAVTDDRKGTIVAASRDRIVATTDGGGNWKEVSPAVMTTDDRVTTMASTPEGWIVCGMSDASQGIAATTDGGNTWERFPGGISNGYYYEVERLAILPSGRLFAHVYHGFGSGDWRYGLYSTPGLGAQWAPSNLYLGNLMNGIPVSVLTVDPQGRPVVGLSTGASVLYRATQGDSAWKSIPFPGSAVHGIVFSPEGEIFIASSGNGVSRTADDGTTWQWMNTGLSELTMTDLAIDGGGFLFAVTAGGFYRTEHPLSAGTSQVVVQEFELQDAYPNPFNPSTTVAFNIPVRSFVTITVFDGIGREISTMVEGEFEPGKHTLVWNAADLPSGVYFYQLRTGSVAITKRMQLIR